MPITSADMLEVSVSILKKLPVALPYDPDLPLPDKLSNDSKSYFKDICFAIFIDSLTKISRK